MIAYFETSALVKAIIEEQGSDVATRLWNSADVVLTSRLTYPEARAALAAARRAGRLSDRTHAAAKTELKRRLEASRVIELAEETAFGAGDFAESHRLRGSDAVHLASATAPRAPELVFTTWDVELLHAAEAAGLSTAGGSS